MNLVKSYWNNLPLLSRALQLSNSVDRYINNFKVVDNLSDRGSLILHLFKVKTVTPQLRPLPGSASPSFFSTRHSPRPLPPSNHPSGVPQTAGDPGLQATAELQSGSPAAISGEGLRVLQPRWALATQQSLFILEFSVIFENILTN